MRLTRFFLGVLLLGILGVFLWNVVGTIRLTDVDERYKGLFYDGTYTGKHLNSEGARLVKDWIETRTRPSWNFAVILRQQFWYNAVTEGYDLHLWLEPAQYDGSLHQYAIYQSGSMVFLRIEFKGRNRVLVASFTAEELEEALRPYVEDTGNRMGL